MSGDLNIPTQEQPATQKSRAKFSRHKEQNVQRLGERELGEELGVVGAWFEKHKEA